jgi:hypothetical protein
VAQLKELADASHKKRLQKEEEAHEAKRRKRLKAMAADPDKVIANVQKLVKKRSTTDYENAARELAQLRDALGPKLGPARARAVAEQLHREYPRFHHLTSALRRQGLLG